MKDPDFTLEKQLKQDCFQICEFSLCLVLLMNDSRFPWLVLVPTLANLTELHQIPAQYREQLFLEIEAASHALQQLHNILKINVAALGNQVPQLHIHVIGRSPSDAAWPGPVWRVGSSVPYETTGKDRMESFLKSAIC